MQQRIFFTCPACGWDSAGDKPELHKPAWAHHAGFAGCVRWTEGAPTSQANMRLLDRRPASGEEHWLSVRLPFSAEAGEPFQCLYKPPLSHCNGWTQHPKELCRSAIVNCTLIGIHNAQPESAVVRAGVGDVWALDELSSLIPPRGQIGASFWDRFATQTVRAARWDKLTYVHGSFEGDVATWALFKARAGHRHLILEGYSSHHAEFVFIGNSMLTFHAEGTLEALLRRASQGS